jgi:rhodanese-related sulfurtransferase
VTVAAIDVHEARRRIHEGREIAFLDVREAGQFGEGHALFAIPCPYSVLELRIGELVPRLTVPVILIDSGDGIAERAAVRLTRLGYADIMTASGGMPAWEAAGFPVYKGVNVPSKTLGELAEAAWHPKMITADTLAAWKTQGRDFAFFDARPPDEYAKMRVPGAACLPNGELAHRLPVAAPGDRPLVITCAGRTRGIIGAIGLRVAGYEEEVLALENGTQGWALAGEQLERGNDPGSFPAMPAGALAETRRRADAMIAKYDLEKLSPEDVGGWLKDADATTYVLDVRSAAEAAADPVAGAVHALSGQLVQATDQWVGVRHARLILLDDAGLRAALAAFWLKQLGYRPAVAVLDAEMRAALAADRPCMAPFKAAETPEIPPSQAMARARDHGAILVDLRSSLAFRKSHVDGAVWTVRPMADRLLSMLKGRAVLLIADDAAKASLVAADLAALGASDVSLVDGGHDALVTAGAPTVSTPDDPTDTDAIDHLFFVHDRHDGNLEASRRYLAWETGLVHQMDEVERAEYHLITP